MSEEPIVVCRACRQPVVWALTINGDPIPLDAEPSERGVFRLEQQPGGSATDRIAKALLSAGRASDAIGRTGQAEFTVFAPSTSTWSAGRLMQRITDTLEQALGIAQQAGGVRAGVHAGYSASYSKLRISPPALLTQARDKLEPH